MTTNQVAYARLQEEKRHNQATENETARSNRFNEMEGQRHNFASEALTSRSTDVNAEHYTRQDAINEIGTLGNVAHLERSDAEDIRHHKKQEDVDMLGLDIKRDTNRINEKYNDSMVFLKGQDILTQRSKIANELALGLQSNQIKAYDVIGRLNVEQSKLPSEIELNKAKTGESESRSKVNEAEVGLKESQTSLNQAKEQESIANIPFVEAKTASEQAHIEYDKWNTIFKGVDSFAKVADSFGKIINGGKKK